MNLRRSIDDYVALTKPRITWLILVSTAIGFFFGTTHNTGWTLLSLFATLAGTGLLASGTAALNQWYERDADAKMRRTQDRPLPSGRLTPQRAFWFAVVLSIVGFLVLWLGANLLTALLGLFTLASYLFLYTPLKRRSPHSTTVGAIPGAMPPLIGFAGACGLLNSEAWLLYAILFLWQFPHFYAIAWMYREDYSRAGIRMLPVVEPDGESTARQMMFFSALLLAASLVPRVLWGAGVFYVFGATLLGVLMIGAVLRAVHTPTILNARKVLLASVVYLPLLYGLLVFDRVL
jgi:protoheme IX farnesyltransferase